MGSSSNSGGGIDKATYEKEWANTEARARLNDTDKAKWAEMGHTIRPFAWWNKIFIVWTYVKGQPQIKEIFNTVSMDASFTDGVWVKLKSTITDRETIITQYPTRLAPGLDLFAWVPYFNELRFASAEWSNPSLPRSLRMSVCFKSKFDPDKTSREGIDFISELHVFRERFPQYRETRF